MQIEGRIDGLIRSDTFQFILQVVSDWVNNLRFHGYYARTATAGYIICVNVGNKMPYMQHTQDISILCSILSLFVHKLKACFHSSLKSPSFQEMQFPSKN